uniref:Uncharacterized protein n=1 Tax=Strongyloides venezuelensis TaxID=75913 RepID=A0A0K0G5N7_STRVS
MSHSTGLFDIICRVELFNVYPLQLPSTLGLKDFGRLCIALFAKLSHTILPTTILISSPLIFTLRLANLFKNSLITELNESNFPN